MDLARVSAAVRELLSALGEDVDSPRLSATPQRVAMSFRELLRGRDERLEVAPLVLDPAPRLVALGPIAFTAVCEHHLLPFTGVAHAVILPDGGRLVGIGEVARVVEVFACRLQLQERLGEEVADALEAILAPRGVMVHLTARHGCLSDRGERARSARFTTVSVRGVLAHDPALRSEALAEVRR